MTNPVLGSYPMTIPQLTSWAKEASSFTVAQCAVLLSKLDQTRSIAIRKVR